MVDMECVDCAAKEEVSDQWECWEEIPLCAQCVSRRFDEAGGVPDHWRIDRD